MSSDILESNDLFNLSSSRLVNNAYSSDKINATQYLNNIKAFRDQAWSVDALLSGAHDLIHSPSFYSLVKSNDDTNIMTAYNSKVVFEKLCDMYKKEYNQNVLSLKNIPAFLSATWFDA